VGPIGIRLTHEKRLALANCNGLLGRACDELDGVMGWGAARALSPDEVEALGPLALRVIELRRRRRRLEAELRAIASEWNAD
jgi:hypothetical protein